MTTQAQMQTALRSRPVFARRFCAQHGIECEAA
jgi:hypothetical protein